MSALLRILGDEGFRLFFPLCALYAALWPLIWVLALGFDLPLARDVPPALWHAHEMIFGAWGAALIGFLTTAVPEWTDTPRLRGRALFGLAGLWALGRAVGLFGWDGAGIIGLLPDALWMGALLLYLAQVSLRARSDALLAFGFWLLLLLAGYLTARLAMRAGDLALAQRALHLSGFAFLGLLGLSLARVTVPVTNLILDPSEATTHFRPHPGRLNLASGLMLVAMLGEAAGLSASVTGFLFCAAGAAFIDRMGEHFIGWPVLRSEILMLGGASATTGAGLLTIGAARLGAPVFESAGLHLALMGGLGLGVMAVMSIAGRIHAGLPLLVPPLARLGGLCLCAATLCRITARYEIAAILWAGGFVLWLIAYWPAMTRLSTGERG